MSNFQFVPPPPPSTPPPSLCLNNNNVDVGPTTALSSTKEESSAQSMMMMVEDNEDDEMMKQSLLLLHQVEQEQLEFDITITSNRPVAAAGNNNYEKNMASAGSSFSLQELSSLTTTMFHDHDEGLDYSLSNYSVFGTSQNDEDVADADEENQDDDMEEDLVLPLPPQQHMKRRGEVHQSQQQPSRKKRNSRPEIPTIPSIATNSSTTTATISAPSSYQLPVLTPQPEPFPFQLASLSNLKLSREMSNPKSACIRKLVLIQNMLQILHVAWIREREIAVAVAAAAAISSSPPVISARVSSVSSSPQVTDLPLPMMQVDDHQESAFAASNAPEAMDDGMHQVALEVEVQVEEMDLDSTTTTTVAPTPTRPLLVSSYAPTGFGEAINPLFLDKEDPYEEEVVIIDEDDHEHNEEENNNDNNTLITLVNNAATASEEQREGGVAEGITATTSIGMAALKLSKEDDEEALLQKTIMAGGKNNTDAPLHYLSPPISPQSSLPLTNSSNNLSSSLSSNSSTLPTPPRKDSLHVVGKSPKSCLKTSSATTTTITSGTHYSIPARLGNTLGSFSLASSNEKSGGDASNQCNSIADSLLEDFMTEADQLFDLNWSLSL